ETLAQRFSVGWDVQGECPQAGQIELRQRRTTLNQSYLALSIGRVEAQLDGVAIGIPAMQGDFEIGVGFHGHAASGSGVRFSSVTVSGNASNIKEDIPGELQEANLFSNVVGVEAVNLGFEGKPPTMRPVTPLRRDKHAQASGAIWSTVTLAAPRLRFLKTVTT